ncbi:MAG: hypothetical protein K8I30_00300, partial [Anaerolineae bacterium]|nr:hypothetical protein [Anaerolineae bacterium]
MSAKRLIFAVLIVLTFLNLPPLLAQEATEAVVPTETATPTVEVVPTSTPTAEVTVEPTAEVT